MGHRVTPGIVIDKFMENLNKGFNYKHVRKPISWALYETWKWSNENEKERTINEVVETE